MLTAQYRPRPLGHRFHRGYRQLFFVSMSGRLLYLSCCLLFVSQVSPAGSEVLCDGIDGYHQEHNIGVHHGRIQFH